MRTVIPQPQHSIVNKLQNRVGKYDRVYPASGNQIIIEVKYFNAKWKKLVSLGEIIFSPKNKSAIIEKTWCKTEAYEEIETPNMAAVMEQVKRMKNEYSSFIH